MPAGRAGWPGSPEQRPSPEEHKPQFHVHWRLAEKNQFFLGSSYCLNVETAVNSNWEIHCSFSQFHAIWSHNFATKSWFLSKIHFCNICYFTTSCDLRSYENKKNKQTSVLQQKFVKSWVFFSVFVNLQKNKNKIYDKLHIFDESHAGLVLLWYWSVSSPSSGPHWFGTRPAPAAAAGSWSPSPPPDCSLSPAAGTPGLQTSWFLLPEPPRPKRGQHNTTICDLTEQVVVGWWYLDYLDLLHLSPSWISTF